MHEKSRERPSNHHNGRGLGTRVCHVATECRQLHADNAMHILDCSLRFAKNKVIYSSICQA
jgi:hypothetical protein